MRAQVHSKLSLESAVVWNKDVFKFALGLSMSMGEDVRGTESSLRFSIKGTKWPGVQILSHGCGMRRLSF